MTTDDVLARLGLQARATTRDYLFPAIGLFAAGILVGSGLGLLFAPRRGSELRAELGQRASRLRARRRGKSTEEYEDLTREELYERAQELGIEGRAEMSKRELYEAVVERGH